VEAQDDGSFPLTLVLLRYRTLRNAGEYACDPEQQKYRD